MKILEMGKEKNISYSVYLTPPPPAPPPPPHTHTHPKYRGVIFLNKALHGGENVFGKLMESSFTWALMITSCKGEGKVSQMQLPLIWTL